VTDNIHLIGESSRLLETCLRIHSEFDRIREEKKKAAKDKREALKTETSAVKWDGRGYSMSSCIVGCTRCVCLLPGGKECGCCAPKRGF